MKVGTNNVVKCVTGVVTVLLAFFIIREAFRQDDFSEVLHKIESFDQHDLNRLSEALGVYKRDGGMGSISEIVKRADEDKESEKKDDDDSKDSKDDSKDSKDDSKDKKDDSNDSKDSKDSKDDNKSDNDSKETKDSNDSQTKTNESDKQTNKESLSSKLLKNPGIRFAIALGVILVINFLAIFVHHIYMKLNSSERSYRSVEHSLSPF